MSVVTMEPAGMARDSSHRNLRGCISRAVEEDSFLNSSDQSRFSFSNSRSRFRLTFISGLRVLSSRIISRANSFTSAGLATSTRRLRPRTRAFTST